MKTFPVLLLLVACSDRAERPTTLAEEPTTTVPRFAMAAAPQADSASICVQRYSKGQSVEAQCIGLSVATRTDTFLVPAPVAARGVPFLQYECTAPTMRPHHTACVRSAGAWSASDLAALKAIGGKLMLNQGGYGKFQRNPPADKTYDPVKYKRWVDSSLAPVAGAWQKYIADGTLLGAQVIDDIGPGTWGTKITQGQQDTMAMWWKQVAPGITTFTREKATGLTGYPWKYLDASITSYNGRYMGDIVQWRDSNYAAAKAAKLGLVLGINVLNGGKLASGCYHGEDAAACAMTATEIRDWGSVEAVTPEVCGIIMWKLNPAYEARPGIGSAYQTIAALAANMPTQSCRRRG